jgi:uncharacterized protein YbbK (DUF523 family)
MARHKILISACLVGEPVRYHGGDSRVDHVLLRQWHTEGRLVPLCPEVAGGLSTPRPAAEITTLASGRRVLTAAGQDVTDAYVRGAEAAVAACVTSHIRVAILKDRSPSCGSHSIHDGTFSGNTVDGHGITTARLRSEGVRVFSESEIEAAAAYLDLLDTQA